MKSIALFSQAIQCLQESKISRINPETLLFHTTLTTTKVVDNRKTLFLRRIKHGMSYHTKIFVY